MECWSWNLENQISFWNYGLRILENQIVFLELRSWNLEDHIILGIMVLEFRQPIYFWNYSLVILENHFIFGNLVL